ncbi:MAG: DNA polymerase III subunit gamma/tau [Christensenellales bacterium]
MSALYRKYRPQKFEDVIAQQHITRTLVNQIEKGKITHAYLFTGSRGTGKTTCARIFARAINCLSPENGSPCGKCEVCKALSGGNIDIIELDAASNNGVDQIREIVDNVAYPPVAGKYKVYIVDEVHMLSGAAFNALLKTLEEPPAHAVFVLATTEVHKLPQPYSAGACGSISGSYPHPSSKNTSKNLRGRRRKGGRFRARSVVAAAEDRCATCCPLPTAA